ncbi:MAG: DUF2851 family protein [Saprospiraceae bacterium]|nr:DUF2851 family protein [Saprospiraceae bacterium]
MISQIELDTLKEDFLYYLWKVKLFDHSDLVTNNGQSIRIIEGGHQNHNAGPDFLQAKVQIGDTIWVGNIEMHLKGSDWDKHGHDADPAYQNVILHVVLINDKEVRLPNGEPLACLSLEHRIKPEIIRRYHQLMGSLTWIPCERSLAQVSPVIVKTWLERILVERLESKTKRIREVLSTTENDWEEAFYRLLARNFGFKVNSDAFESLAIVLPRKILLKHKDQIQQIESLVFGQAGLLRKTFQDPYLNKLREEYDFLARKYRLTPIDTHRWKFMRLRPANFPTIRLAQFAVLFFRSNHLFSKMLAATSVNEVYEMFRTEVTAYWKEHYSFDEMSQRKSKKLGKASIQLLIINTVAPFLFHYGKIHQKETLTRKAIDFLCDLPAESNRIIRQFEAYHVKPDNAMESQAILELKTNYCDLKRCLECAIGHSLLKPADKTKE